jgi:hypothetical protein
MGRLKYRWARTWPDKKNDYVADDQDRIFGRIYLHPDNVRWQWFLNGDGLPQSTGFTESKDAAAAALEAAYSSLKPES